jgi:peptide/nickel transport system substrate-binding protein
MGQLMKSSEEFVPNERLRRARSLKGWSQADLAEQIGTSFEIVSRWERGVTIPSPYYRERLCAVLGQSAEDLGLLRARPDAFTSPSTPLVLLASSHEDAEKAIVSQLKSALQEQGFTLWSSRQLSRQGNGNVQTTLREIVRTAQVILVIVSPQARASRHVRETLETANRYQRPVCGVWIEGERWQECLPKGSGELAAVIDARHVDDAVLLDEVVSALERVGLVPCESGMSAPAMGAMPLASQPAVPTELVTPQGQATGATPPPSRALEPTVAATPLPAEVPLLPLPPRKRQRRRVSRRTAGLIIGLAVLVLAGGILGSLSLLAHFGVIGPRNGALIPVRGGTWTADTLDPDSLIPNKGDGNWIDQALYLPLFYGDAQGVVHPGAAREIPTVHNGGISADATTWTFHLRPRLVWSDGEPYDARDVDYTWKLWLNPRFGAGFPNGATGFKLIREASVSPDHLSITFHLKQAYAPFRSFWVDGYFAPLPAHHFSAIAPQAIVKSPDLLNPSVTSGPFMMAERVPGDHYTLVRNPRYYRASEGLPYLDKVVLRSAADQDAILKDLQAGTFTSARFLDVDASKVQAYQRLSRYTLVASPTSNQFEALWFNFHNTILASHLEVRQAMAMAIDHQALIQVARQGFATPLCTDHPSALHPGYELYANCPVFDPALANQLLSDNGWVKGADGVRAIGGQRLEFEYSTCASCNPGRIAGEAIIERNFKAIGIKLDIHNYSGDTYFRSFLPGGKASPPTGAVAGRYDIAEWANGFSYDPDDSSLLACDQIPPNGGNWEFYCNPALDALYTQELATADAGVRQQIFHQIHQIYLAQLPFITLYSPTALSTVRKGTHNYQRSPFAEDTVNMWEWWCDQGKC